jgi:hypothetical protein
MSSDLDAARSIVKGPHMHIICGGGLMFSSFWFPPALGYSDISILHLFF